MRTRDTTTPGDVRLVLEECIDAVLWQGVRRGDDRAFEVLYRRHAAMVYRVCRGRLSRGMPSGDVAARCEDAVSETFLHAWRRRDAIRVDTSLGPWLVVAAGHTCDNLLRADRRRLRLLLHLAEQPVVVMADDEPGTCAARADLVSHLHLAVAELPPLDARVARMCLLDGLAPREVAAALGVGEQALRARLARVRRELRGRLVHLRHELLSVLPAIGAALGACAPVLEVLG